MQVNAPKTVTVIGGGLAGLAAATHLAESGFQVTVLEKRAILGGRASSTLDPQTGEALDNCQHVLLKCCTELMGLYQRLGVDSKISFHDEMIFMDGAGKISRLRASPLPRPFHLLPSFFKLSFLNWKDKLGILKAMAWIALTADSKLNSLESLPFSEWLQRHGQTREALNRFWRIFLVSALNEELERISTQYAFKTFREAFFKNPDAYHLGVPSVPLSELYSNPSLAYLKKRGGKILFQKNVERLEIENKSVKRIVLKEGDCLSSDFYISAVPFHEVLDLFPPKLIQSFPDLEKLKHLETSPITGIHLFFDSSITHLDRIAFVDKKIQWLFNKTKSFSRDQKGQYIQLVISASREWIGLSKAQAVDLALKELSQLFPEVKKARLLKSSVIKELHATFSPLPGSNAFRPSAQSPFENLFWAGDWTATDWPATMESAVRSGNLAAEEIMKKAKSS
ncbi:MAG: FAD-dependent oxidoreductase [Chlamydiae bacterium]|nr:FAD-dependent oxidoreductase [Chlamydiota bacterium]MBI3266556.1 FAD-dependent oxidoreductase [Chlamydiota bacterium]